MTRGVGGSMRTMPFERIAWAAAASRRAESRKSMLAPVESTARYKYVHLPFTRM
jgi:hypothetical protein